jgi:hypothetical protein
MISSRALKVKGTYASVGTALNDAGGESCVERIDSGGLALVRAHRVAGHAGDGVEGERVILGDTDVLALEDAVPDLPVVVREEGKGMQGDDGVDDANYPGTGGLGRWRGRGHGHCWYVSKVFTLHQKTRTGRANQPEPSCNRLKARGSCRKVSEYTAHWLSERTRGLGNHECCYRHRGGLYANSGGVSDLGHGVLGQKTAHLEEVRLL